MTGFDIGRRDVLKIAGTGMLYTGVSSAGMAQLDAGTAETDRSAYVFVDEDGEPQLVDSADRMRAVYQNHDVGSRLSATSVDEGDIGTTSEHVETGLLVTADGQTDRGNVPAGATLEIWAGAIDSSGTTNAGVPNESVTVSVQNFATGESDEFDLTTGSNGTVVSEYDLGAELSAEGRINVSVTHDNGNTATVSFEAGTTIESTSVDSTRVVHTDEEVTLSFLARDGLDPVSGLELDLIATRDGNLVEETTETTDADGFASVSFTPESPGRYDISAETDGEVGASDSVVAGEQTLAVPIGTDEALADQESFFGGYLSTTDGPLPNTEFRLQFIDGTQTYLDRTVTTDETGFFGVTYTLSGDIDPDSLTAVAETPGGEQIPVAAGFIDLNRFEGPDEPEVLRARTEQFTARPGGQITMNVEAIDDGTPITDEEVSVYFQYDFRGPPAYTETVTTDSNGKATVSFTLPDNAPDDTTIRGNAAIAVDGEEFTDPTFNRVRETIIDFDSSGVAPGETATFSVNAIDTETDEGISGVPQQFDLLYGAERTGSIETVGLETGSDGVDEANVSIPSDAPPELYANYFNRYSSFGRLFRPQLPGSLSATLQGREIELSLDVPTGTTVRGVVFETMFTGVAHTIGTTLTTEGTATLRIPDYVSDEFLSLQFWGADENGQLYNGFADVEFDGEGSSVTASLSPDSTELDPNSEATLDLVMQGASEGVSTYQATIQSEDVSVVAVSDVSLNGDPADATVDVTDDGVQAVLDVDMGENIFEAGSPAVAEITVESAGAGTADLSLSAVSVTNANREDYSTVASAGTTVTVVDAGPPTIVDGNPVQDPDGDDLYEDVDGDGQLTLDDVRVLYQNLDSDTVQDNAELFNFGGGDPDEVTIGDLHALFEEL